MLVCEYVEIVRGAIKHQQDHFAKTGEIIELVLPKHENIKLTVDPSDPPEVRRRVILFNSELEKWRRFGVKQKAELDHDKQIMSNINSHILDLLGV